MILHCTCWLYIISKSLLATDTHATEYRQKFKMSVQGQALQCHKYMENQLKLTRYSDHEIETAMNIKLVHTDRTTETLVAI